MPAFEDEYFDIIGKAAHGLGLSSREIASRSGLGEDAVAALMDGSTAPGRPGLLAVAPILGLSPGKLADFALAPEPPRRLDPPGRCLRLVLGAGFTSNGYLLACPDSGEGVIVDPGGDGAKILAGIDRLRMRPVAVLVTHAHFDHVGALRDIQDRYPVPAIVLKAEGALPGAAPGLSLLVEDGHAVRAGSLEGRFLHVPGHTPGSAAIAFTGVAFTGDVMFARSLGRAAGSGPAYARFLEESRRKVLALPDDTILCPGHGPLTTVGDEKRLNPFFP